MFGIGKKTGLALPEKAGLMPTRAWKKDVRNERWWKGETLSTCIGQGYTLVTPLQTACMIGAVCTGKLVQPRLNDEEEFVHSLVPVSTQTLQFLRNGMREAVQYGSAQRLKGLRGFEIAAKTGTAQTCSLSVEQLYKHQMEHAWFGGFFSYQGQKPLVLVIIIENAGHSRDAVELAHRFLVGYRALQESEAKSQSDS